MRVRAMTLGIVVLGALVLSAGRAAAGGSVFDFRRDSYRPGEVAVGISTDVWINSKNTAKPKDGPFYAYLVRAGRVMHGPRLSPHRMIPLGAITFTKTRPGFVNARIAFTVPTVPHGEYGIEMCNKPCTDRWVGDLVGGWFFIGTPLEHRVFELDGEMQYQTRQLRAQNQKLRRLRDDVTTGLASLQDGLRAGLAGVNRHVGSGSGLFHSLWPLAGWAMAGMLALILTVQAIRRRLVTPEAPPQLRDGSPHPDFDRVR